MKVSQIIASYRIRFSIKRDKENYPPLHFNSKDVHIAIARNIYV